MCLNPCFNGRYSQRLIKISVPTWNIEVLILVLMEDTLRVHVDTEQQNKLSLNPCFNGRYSQRRCISQMLSTK